MAVFGYMGKNASLPRTSSLRGQREGHALQRNMTVHCIRLMLQESDMNIRFCSKLKFSLSFFHPLGCTLLPLHK